MCHEREEQQRIVVRKGAITGQRRSAQAKKRRPKKDPARSGRAPHRRCFFSRGGRVQNECVHAALHQLLVNKRLTERNQLDRTCIHPTAKKFTMEPHPPSNDADSRKKRDSRAVMVQQGGGAGNDKDASSVDPPPEQSKKLRSADASTCIQEPASSSPATSGQTGGGSESFGRAVCCW